MTATPYGPTTIPSADESLVVVRHRVETVPISVVNRQRLRIDFGQPEPVAREVRHPCGRRGTRSGHRLGAARRIGRPARSSRSDASASARSDSGPDSTVSDLPVTDCVGNDCRPTVRRPVDIVRVLRLGCIGVQPLRPGSERGRAAPRSPRSRRWGHQLVGLSFSRRRGSDSC